MLDTTIHERSSSYIRDDSAGEFFTVAPEQQPLPRAAARLARNIARLNGIDDIKHCLDWYLQSDQLATPEGVATFATLADEQQREQTDFALEQAREMLDALAHTTAKARQHLPDGCTNIYTSRLVRLHHDTVGTHIAPVFFAVQADGAQAQFVATHARELRPSIAALMERFYAWGDVQQQIIDPFEQSLAQTASEQQLLRQASHALASGEASPQDITPLLDESATVAAALRLHEAAEQARIAGDYAPAAVLYAMQHIAAPSYESLDALASFASTYRQLVAHGTGRAWQVMAQADARFAEFRAGGHNVYRDYRPYHHESPSQRFAIQARLIGSYGVHVGHAAKIAAGTLDIAAQSLAQTGAWLEAVTYAPDTADEFGPGDRDGVA